LRDQEIHLSIKSIKENSRKSSKLQEENEEQKVEDLDFLIIPDSCEEMK